jgi:periplasmic divalent cation tolerance protein
MTGSSQAMLVLTNVPDADAARTIGCTLVEERLAACVNCLPNVTSFYRWQGALEEATEITLLIKTRPERYAEVEAMIRQLHPYELPEIIGFDLDQGLPDYLRWIAQET